MRLGACFLLASILVACGGSSTPTDSGASDLGADAAGDASHDLGGGEAGCASPDSDSDGHRSLACGGDDCDDADPNSYPGHAEVCDAAGHDEDCDPATLGPDGDGDGEPGSGCCDTQAGGSLRCGADCDDTRATVSSTAVETCNGVDDDCDGDTDEGMVLTDFYPDCDGDGFGDGSATLLSACAAPATPPTCGGGWVTTRTDCRDDATGVHPGATAPCDCTGTAFDGDGDGFVASRCGGDDCDDGDASLFPGNTETCDGRDEDCDGVADAPLATRCVTCGMGACTGAEGCCHSPGASCAVATTCISSGASAFVEDCDDAADCASGLCCLHLSTGIADAYRSYCATSCTAGDLTACREDGDCGTGTCISHDLSSGLTALACG